MSLKDNVKLFVVPIVISGAALFAFFIGGLRIGAEIQKEQDQPMIEECVNQLIDVMTEGGANMSHEDAGTP